MHLTILIPLSIAAESSKMAPSSKLNVHKLETFTAAATLLATSSLVMVLSITKVEAIVNHVGIANSFHSYTQITCHSNRQYRQAYTATTYEIYYFAFEDCVESNEVCHQFWDCLISNTAEQRRASFRMWADISHGGSQLGGCSTCNWSVDERGVFLRQDSAWRFQYSWP
jgi:hypothetical protein